MLELIPLGTNGFYPSFGRQTMCFALRAGRTTLLLDAGTGLGRLFSTHLPFLEGVEHLDILLTHYHLDHVLGLATLSHAYQGSLTIHSPQAPLVDETDATAALERLLSPPLFPVRLSAFASAPLVKPYTGPDLELLGRHVQVRRQQHPGGSAGVRIGDELAYVTDTAADSATVDFVRGVRLLLHEVWVSDEEGRENPRLLTGHTAVGDALRIAAAAEVGALMPVHHQPKRSRQDVERLVASMQARSEVPVIMGDEGRVYPLEQIERAT